MKCEMNIPLSREALINAGLFEEFGDVLFGFEFGFHQGVPPHTINGMRWFTPPNHSLSLEAKEKIRENFSKEIVAGRMFGPYTYNQVSSNFDFFPLSPLGAVVNGEELFKPSMIFHFLMTGTSSQLITTSTKKTLRLHGTILSWYPRSFASTMGR
jgi:hypothetical protein